MALRSVALIAVLALLSTSVRATTYTPSPVKTAIEQSVQEAVAKVLASFGAIQNQVEAPIQQVASQMQGALQGGVNLMGSFAQPVGAAALGMTQQAAQDYTNMGKYAIQSAQTMRDQFLSHLLGMGSQMGGAYDQISTVLEGFEGKYCTPASFIPSIKKPSKFTGPSFDLTFLSGSCEFNEEAFLHENKKELICFEPSITFTKTPANFTSKYKAAPEFTAKECKISKTFGEDVKKVLFVFDGQNPVDLGALTNTIMTEVRGTMGSLLGGGRTHLTTQMQQFMSGLSGMMGSFPNKAAMFPSMG